MSDMLNRLQTTRPGYEAERQWHKLLLDAYRGTGGFQGNVKQPEAGFWGAAAESYSNTAATLNLAYRSSDSYIDRYHREDTDKFNRRIGVSHYLNYVKPTTNLKISYIVRKPHKRNNVPPALMEWIERSGYDKDARRRALVAAVFGYFLVFVDRPKPPAEALTMAQAGNLDPYVVMMFPSQVLDYSVDDRGVFNWVKFGTTSCEQPTWDAEAQELKRYTILTREDYQVWESIGNAEATSKDAGRHGLKVVPCVSWRADASVEDPVKADSINAEIVPEVRRLFNLLSELDENLRSTVFPLLIVPREATEEGTPAKQIGAENGLTVSPEQKNLPQYIAPPESVASTYETRIEKTIIEIFRMARVEYDKASGVRSNAQSQEQNFQQTNLSIVDFASSLAKADRETLILVGRMLGLSEAALDAIECVPHDSYAEAQLNDEIEQVVAAVTGLAIGNTAKGELVKRLMFRMLPGIGADLRAKIESEVDEALVKAEQEAALMQEAERKNLTAGVEEPDEDETKKAPPADNAPPRGGA